MIEKELLPLVETVRVRKRVTAVQQDPEDDKFLVCALAGLAEYLVTGDQDLLELRAYRGITICTVGTFFKIHGDEST